MNEFSDRFLSLESSKEIQVNVSGSKFIASAFPLKNEEQAQEYIRKVKKEFHDATHHCFAYHIQSKDEEIFKVSDAGEPKGTAGKPILSAIKSKNLYNVLVVVTRYFGGIKLGKGGLSRAYFQSAKEVLEKCKIIGHFITYQLSISFPLNSIGKVSRVLAKYDAEILNKDFSSKVNLVIEIRASQKENIVKTLVETTGGQVKFI